SGRRRGSEAAGRSASRGRGAARRFRPLMKVLAYTSPARGHLTPMMGPLLELRRRGADVHVRTLAAGVENVRAAGIEAEPIAVAIEEVAHDDHEARVQLTSGARSFRTLRRRAEHEVPDFEAALDAAGP